MSRQGTRRREARAREVRVFSVSYSRSADPFDTGGTLGVRLMTPLATGGCKIEWKSRRKSWDTKTADKGSAMSSSATDGVAVIVISNASTSRVNALAAAVRVHLKESILSALEDPSINAIILVGNPDGTGMFSAGADIKEFSAPTDGSGGVTTAQNGVPTLNDLGHMIEGSSKPIIAALSGVALGGGMELALASHYRVADRTLRYGYVRRRVFIVILSNTQQTTLDHSTRNFE